MLLVIDGNKDKEKEIHDKFKNININGEWYNPKKELLEFIDKLKSKKHINHIDSDRNHRIKCLRCGKIFNKFLRKNVNQLPKIVVETYKNLDKKTASCCPNCGIDILLGSFDIVKIDDIFYRNIGVILGNKPRYRIYNNDTIKRCIFCGKASKDSQFMFTSLKTDGQLFICDECIEILADFIKCKRPENKWIAEEKLLDCV